jgi:hypothetical protein
MVWSVSGFGALRPATGVSKAEDFRHGKEYFTEKEKIFTGLC